jgi:hypothetical protein
MGLRHVPAGAARRDYQWAGTAAVKGNFLANGGIPGVRPPQGSAAQVRAVIASYTFDQNRHYALNGSSSVQRLLGRDYVVEPRRAARSTVQVQRETERLRLEASGR